MSHVLYAGHVLTTCFSSSDPKSRQLVQRRYRSQMADQICYAVLCVFSYVAAGQEEQRRRNQSNKPCN